MLVVTNVNYIRAARHITTDIGLDLKFEHAY